MFTKKINRTSRKEMTAFLSNHFRYHTMNSWNHMTSYANNVKLNKLDVPSNLFSKALDFIYCDCFEYRVAVTDLIRDFENETGYTAGFNGRSDGYIVLYDTKIENNQRLTCAHGIDDYEDFSDWDMNALRNRAKLVQAFDKLCDDIRNTFFYYITNAELRDVEIVKTETVKIAVLSDF